MIHTEVFILEYYCDCGKCDFVNYKYLNAPPEVIKAFPNAIDVVEMRECRGFLHYWGYHIRVLMSNITNIKCDK